MSKTVSMAALLAAFVIPAFGCEKPDAPTNFPDGKSAAMEEMMAAKKAVDSFKKGMEEYLVCEKNASKLDRAQGELERVAARFNAEVRAFKTKT